MPTASPIPPATPTAPVRRRWKPPAVVRWGLWALLLSVLLWARHFWWAAPFETLARRSLSEQEFDRALGWLNYSDLLVKRRAETELLRARAYRGQGDMPRVATSLQAAQREGASPAEIRREEILAMAQSGQMSQAGPHLSRLLTAQRGDNREVCEAYVLGYMRTRQFEPALMLLKTWLEDAPDDAQAHFLRARILSLLQNSKDATANFGRAHQLAPHRNDIAVEYGEALRNENRPREAIPYFEQSLDDPRLAVRALVGLAGCHKTLGDVTRAHDLLTQAVARDPEHADAVRELGRLEFEAGEYDKAALTLRRAMELAPTDDECQYLLAQSLQLAGRAEEAAPFFKYVSEARQAHRELHELKDRLRSHPRDVEVLVRAGSINLRYSIPDEGVIQLLAALDIDPQHREALQLLSDYYSRRATENAKFRPLAEEYRSRLQALSAEAP